MGYMKNKSLAAVLCFFLGMLGVHKFYLGEYGKGGFILFLTLAAVTMPIALIWVFINFIQLLTMSQADFDYKYNTEVTIIRKPKGQSTQPATA